jgi:hypothetical protein
MRLKIVIVAAMALLTASLAYAQTATPANKYQWTQQAQSATVAQAATYPHYLDGAATPSTTLTAACTQSGADATCTAPIPALTIGNHTVTLSQLISGAESPKSSPVTFTFVVVVQPTGLRIAKLFGFYHGGVLSHRGRVDLHRVQIRNLHRVSE